jgi:hypothetical protein
MNCISFNSSNRTHVYIYLYLQLYVIIVAVICIFQRPGHVNLPSLLKAERALVAFVNDDNDAVLLFFSSFA